MNINYFINKNSRLGINQFFLDKYQHVIYLICEENGEVIYIGKTSILHYRIKAHYARPELNEKPVYYFLYPKDEIGEFEKELIKKYKPKYNIQCNNNGEYSSNYQIDIDYQKSLKSPIVRIRGKELRKRIKIKYKYYMTLASKMNISKQLLYGWMNNQQIPIKALKTICDDLDIKPINIIHKNVPESLKLLKEFENR